MAFVEENSTIVSFAEFQDVVNRDSRIFDANESLSDDIVDAHLIRATERILDRLRASDWWRSYYVRQSGATYDPLIFTSGLVAVPKMDPNKILDRQADFTDLCVYYALATYILPKVADFSREDNSERVKIGFFNEKYRSLFQELLDDGSWYDFSGDGTISNKEKMPVRTNVVRVR